MVSQSMALAMGQHGQRWRLSMLRGFMPLTSRRCLITKVCWLSSLVCCIKLLSAGLAVKACRTFNPVACRRCCSVWASLHAASAPLSGHCCISQGKRLLVQHSC